MFVVGFAALLSEHPDVLYTNDELDCAIACLV